MGRDPKANREDGRMDYEAIQAGQRVIVLSRGNATGIVDKKFRSVSDAPGAPAGTEYVGIQFDGGGYGFNYPHQIALSAEGAR